MQPIKNESSDVYLSHAPFMSGEEGGCGMRVQPKKGLLK